jgi:formate hydrogenlyase subunit 6/NADH:ubiquinone oxidoreductase subunit I
MIRPGAMFKTLLSSVFRKPATENYPAVKAVMPDDFRGQINFLASNCIGCKICMRDCPSDAIEIRKVGEKRFEAAFDLGRCIYCAQCVDSCPKSALETTDRFELAALDSKKLTVLFEAAPEAAKPAGPQPQTQNPPQNSSGIASQSSSQSPSPAPAQAQTPSQNSTQSPSQASSPSQSTKQPQTQPPADSVHGTEKSV